MNPTLQNVLATLAGLMFAASLGLLLMVPQMKNFVSLPPVSNAEAVESCCALNVSLGNNAGARLQVQALSGPAGFVLPPATEVTGPTTLHFPAPGEYTLRIVAAGRESQDVAVTIAAENAATAPLVISFAGVAP